MALIMIESSSILTMLYYVDVAYLWLFSPDFFSVPVPGHINKFHSIYITNYRRASFVATQPISILR